MARALWGVVAGGLTAAAVAAAVAFAGPAAASTGGQAVMVGQAATDGTPKFCAKLDAISQRGQTLLTRLNADASTKGSIAWLTARADAATAAGDAELATRLSDRAARRTEFAQTLTTLGPDLLAAAQAHCP